MKIDFKEMELENVEYIYCHGRVQWQDIVDNVTDFLIPRKWKTY
jgi:hypothetical protein